MGEDARDVAIASVGRACGWGMGEHASLGLQLTSRQLTPRQVPGAARGAAARMRVSTHTHTHPASAFFQGEGAGRAHDDQDAATRGSILLTVECFVLVVYPTRTSTGL